MMPAEEGRLRKIGREIQRETMCKRTPIFFLIFFFFWSEIIFIFMIQGRAPPQKKKRGRIKKERGREGEEKKIRGWGESAGDESGKVPQRSSNFLSLSRSVYHFQHSLTHAHIYGTHLTRCTYEPLTYTHQILYQTAQDSTSRPEERGVMRGSPDFFTCHCRNKKLAAALRFGFSSLSLTKFNERSDVEKGGGGEVPEEVEWTAS